MTPEEQRMMIEMERLQQMRAPNALLARSMTPEAQAGQETFMAARQQAMQPREAVGPAPGSSPPNPFLSGLSRLGRKALDFTKDPAAMARLSAGLQSMTLNPNQGLIQSQMQRSQDIKGRREAGRQINQTASFLRAQGRDDLAAVIEQNPAVAPMILKSMFDKPKGVVVGEGADLVNPATGELIYSGQNNNDGLTSKVREEANKLIKEYTGNAATKDFQKQAGAYTRVVASAKNPTAAGDLSLIFNYMKVLDPGSVVRESEFATAAGARAELTRAQDGGMAIPSVVKQAMQRVETGLRLLPEQRRDFLTRAGMLYQGAATQHAPFRNFYGEKVQSIAPGYGMPPVGYIGEVDVDLEPGNPQQDEIMTVPPASWDGGDSAWLALNDDEKRQYLEEE